MAEFDGTSQQDIPKVAVMNPIDSVRTAQFAWSGNWVEIKPGEVKLLAPWFAQHAQKSNQFLIVMDTQDSESAYAEARVKMAETQLAEETRKLEAQSQAIKAKQAALIQAQSNLKAKRDQEAQDRADQEAAAAQFAKQQEDKAKAAAQAAGVAKK